jgi:hypothetical protein
MPLMGVQKPQALAVGPAGQVVTIDNKTKTMSVFDRAGAPLLAVSWSAAGVERPIALDFGCDGSMVLFDGADQRCMRVP